MGPPHRLSAGARPHGFSPARRRPLASWLRTISTSARCSGTWPGVSGLLAPRQYATRSDPSRMERQPISTATAGPRTGSGVATRRARLTAIRRSPATRRITTSASAISASGGTGRCTCTDISHMSGVRSGCEPIRTPIIVRPARRCSLRLILRQASGSVAAAFGSSSTRRHGLAGEASSAGVRATRPLTR